jgi:hypothetical protein
MAKLIGAGGTSGGIGQFFLGCLLAGLGLYLFLDRIIVMSGLWSIFGFSGYGAALIPLMLGIGMLFFNGKSIGGWILAVGSFLVIFVGIITHLTFFFMPTNLLVTLLMLGMIAGGLGMIARSLRSKPGSSGPPPPISQF